jgi:hypothetical protein
MPVTTARGKVSGGGVVGLALGVGSTLADEAAVGVPADDEGGLGVRFTHAASTASAVTRVAPRIVALVLTGLS